ncbi:MAG TPA: TetR/AcrR family transcriptional regulator [Rhizobacter sp.]|nr:TetR/AcrR family transcriptional regulator [Rhizobacter sp.]
MVRKREKSEQTLAAIVAAGMDIAVNQGLQKLTLNSIAQKLGISKSGVFVRVGSLESLQILVLDEYERIFALTVFMPTLSEPAGLPRLNAIVHRWVHHGNELTALIASHYAVNTFDNDPDAHPDALRTRLVNGMMAWRQTLERTVKQALDRGQIRPDSDPEQLVFEIFSLLTGFLYDAHVKRDPKCFERVMSAYARLMSTYRSFSG